MKIKVSAGFTGVIATGSYENMRPSYTAEVEFDGEVSQIETWQKSLQEICFGNFKGDEQKAIVDRINRERQDIRFYGEYPSVTSVINWDADFFVSKEELAQYASQGQLIHAQVAEFISCGQWKIIKDVQGTWADIVICTQGSLKLPIDGWDFPAFLKKYKLEKMQNGKPILSHKDRVGGTPDIRVCYYEDKKYLADVKRTAEKIKNGKQLAEYISIEEENGEASYDGGMVIVLNDKTEQGFSKPIIYDRTQIDQYKLMFNKDRENFKKRFNA